MRNEKDLRKMKGKIIFIFRREMSKTKSPTPFILNEGIMCNLCRKRMSPYWGEMGAGLIL